MIDTILQSIVGTGEVVTVLTNDGNWTDYLFYSRIRHQYTIYNTTFTVEDVNKIVVTQNVIAIDLR